MSALKESAIVFWFNAHLNPNMQTTKLVSINCQIPTWKQKNEQETKAVTSEENCNVHITAPKCNTSIAKLNINM